MLLRRAEIGQRDLSEALSSVEEHDFVYLGPPYPGTFAKYDGNGFGYGRQVELAKMRKVLHDKRVFLMMTNGYDERISVLYSEGYFRKIVLEGHTHLSGLPEGRKKVRELLIINYEPKTGTILQD